MSRVTTQYITDLFVFLETTMSTRIVVFAVASLLSASFAQPAFAHATLKDASPKSGAVLDTAPTKIRLHFNEALEAAYSKIKLTNAQGVAIKSDGIKVDPAHPETMVLTPPALPSGAFQVEWSAMTQDGHRTKGSYSFKVK
ncbi:MAG: copper homeostasis periplasmic binding protein CopC [Collimonas sp.]